MSAEEAARPEGVGADGGTAASPGKTTTEDGTASRGVDGSRWRLGAPLGAAAGDSRRFAELLFDAAKGAGVERPVFEVRVVNWHAKPRYDDAGVNSGYFSDPSALVRAASSLDARGAEGVYVTPNPLRDSLVARAANKIKPRAKSTANDADVVRRLWLPIDVDPRRPAGISSSDGEHEAALARAQAIEEFLGERGWPAPVRGDSGNGAHLLYRINLPPEDGGLVQRALKELAARFDDGAVKVDVGVHNPARIWKCYGTKARKGDDVSERPHRRARLLDVPEALKAVSADLLERLGGEAPNSPPRGQEHPVGARGTGVRFDVERFLARHGLEVVKEKRDGKGRRVLVLARCPFDPVHADGGNGGCAVVTVETDGKIGFKCHHNACSARGWRDVRELLEPAANRGGKNRGGPSGPFPASLASREARWPDPLDPAAYHGLAGEIVRALEPYTEADPAALLLQLLVAVGSVIGRGVYWLVNGTRHHLNEFLVLVGETSKARKGTSSGMVLDLIRRVAPDWAGERIVHGLSSGEGLIWAVRDAIEKVEPVREKKQIVGYQSVIADPGVQDKRLHVVEEEFGRVLRVMQREGNTLSAVVRSAWDSGDLRSLTKNSPAKATGAHVSVIGHVTRDELLRLLDETETANGFGNRFLWACVQRARCLPDGAAVPESVVVPLAERLRAVIDHVRALSSEVTPPGQAATGDPSFASFAFFADRAREIRRSPVASEVWREIYPELSAGRPGLGGALTARAEAHVMRIACLYAVLDLSSEIDVEHLEAALAVLEYVERSVAYVFGDATGDPVADAILRALRAHGEGLSRSAISDLFGRHQQASRIGQALAHLGAAGKVRCESTSTGGRPLETWVAAEGED